MRHFLHEYWLYMRPRIRHAIRYFFAAATLSTWLKMPWLFQYSPPVVFFFANMACCPIPPPPRLARIVRRFKSTVKYWAGYDL